MEIIGYILTLVMGISLGLLGGGGSILTVPILIYLFKIDAVNATAYSLFIVGIASAFGAVTKYKKDLVDVKVGIIFAVPGFLGVFLTRAFVVPSLPDTIATLGSFALSKNLLIIMVFAIMMILASFSMIRGRKETEVAMKNSRKSFVWIAIEGLVIGSLTGFVGAGGGFLIIPALVVLAGLPMKKAVGTSLMIISLKSLFGFLGDVMTNPDIQWGFLLGLSVLSILGIFIGAYLSQFVPEKKLKKVFGYFVLIMGTFILGQQIYG